MKIAIPSYRRPNNCITAEWCDRGIIFCHESEAEAYAKGNKNDIIQIPDELAGKGMAVIRNFILNSIDDDVLMLDDDIKSFGFYEKNETREELDAMEFYLFAEDMFQMAKDAGTVLWGVNLQSDKKFYREYSPFSLSSVVLGPCFGVVKNDLRFDERLGLKEDYDYALQVLLKHRKVLRNNKFNYIAGHINKSGGCASYRTSLKEIAQLELFQRKWGSKIVKIHRKTQGGNVSINPVVIAPINGI
jgi:hypothetical protein